MAYGLLLDYLLGQCIEGFSYFGAHFGTKKSHASVSIPPKEKGGVPDTVALEEETPGVYFRLYAPLAEDVSVIGEWNGWDPSSNKMEKIDESGVFEAFVPGLSQYQAYKYHFKGANGAYVDKADPYAFCSETRPGSCSRLFDLRDFAWHDEGYLQKRTRSFDGPMAIYEAHLGSWKGKVDGRYPSYEEAADFLIPYLKELGYTHVEVMPLCQYPYDGSWGYQATGFFSVDSRYGNPKQLMAFVDKMHQAGIGVILDFAPVHFATDEFGLREFDGSCMYEYADPAHTLSPWGSAQFDLEKDPVRSFLMSAMNFFLSEFHFDGIRVDAVSNIIYWDGDKSKGENFGAIEFLKRLNGKLHLAHPSAMMIAEDSTDYQGVTKPTEWGGLGFDYKWDLGWMNDTLKYYSLDPIYKKYEHTKINFSMAYFFSENFLLPLSHDEVVHGKGTILNKMWGDYETKFALVRNLYVYLYAHPGKKLSFMGNELASFDEWNELKSLPWELLHYPKHDSVRSLVKELNRIYREEKAMNAGEYDPSSFRWLMVDNANDSVFAFERRNGKESLIFVFNMTPNYYEYYTIGTMEEGVYDEILNSDQDIYGGKNQYNGLPCSSKRGEGPEGRPCQLALKLGGFAACILKKRN